MGVWGYPLVIAPMLGLVSTVHCAGMRGGIMGMLSMGLSLEVRSERACLGPRFVYAGYCIGALPVLVAAGFLIGFSTRIRKMRYLISVTGGSLVLRHLEKIKIRDLRRIGLRIQGVPRGAYSLYVTLGATQKTVP